MGSMEKFLFSNSHRSALQFHAKSKSPLHASASAWQRANNNYYNNNNSLNQQRVSGEEDLVLPLQLPKPDSEAARRVSGAVVARLHLTQGEEGSDNKAP